MTPQPPTKDSRSLLAADAAKLWLGAIVEQVLALIRGVILPRYLGPGLYGILGGLGLITKYGGYLQLGVNAAVAREVPHALATGARERADRITRAIYSFNLLTSTGPGFLIVAYTLLTWGRYRADVTWGLLVFAFLLVVNRFEEYFTTLFRARRHFSSSFLYTSIKAVVGFVLVVGLVYPYRLYGVFIGLVAAGAFMIILGSAWTHTWAGPWPRWAVIKELLPVGLPLAAIGVTGFVLQSIDRLLIIKFLSARELGYYSLAITVVTFIYFLPMNIGQAMAPRIYGLPRGGDRRAFEEYVVKPSLVVTFTVAVIGGLAVLSFVPFVRYVLPAYSASVPVVAALLVGVTCQGGVQGAGHMLIALGRFKTIGFAQVVSIALAAALIYAAIKMNWGLTWVGAGASAGLVCYACILQFEAWRALGLSSRSLADGFLYLLLPPAAVAAALFFAFYVGTHAAVAIIPPTGVLGDFWLLSARLVFFVPAAGAFGFYVEKQTGFIEAVMAKIKERFGR